MQLLYLIDPTRAYKRLKHTYTETQTRDNRRKFHFTISLSKMRFRRALAQLLAALPMPRSSPPQIAAAPRRRRSRRLLSPKVATVAVDAEFVPHLAAFSPFHFTLAIDSAALIRAELLREQFEEFCVQSEEAKHQFRLDGGFVAPNINSFGHSFRNYDAESERQKGVEEFYRLQHINQTHDFVKRMREEYGKLDKVEMGIWECCELLNEVVDDSDPDLDEPQIQHLLQSAEGIRKDYPDEDWLHLTALIHDLGKILILPRFGELPQWAVVGDTFPLGCAFDESNVHHEYFKDNLDSKNPAYNTKNGIYNEGCGLDNVVMSWGHDDYMYLVAKENGTTLPPAALFIIRYHSFYPLHKEGAYTHLMNEEDIENLKWLKIFNKYDLYSKSNVRVDIEKVKPYYISLIEKYFPAKLRW